MSAFNTIAANTYSANRSVLHDDEISEDAPIITHNESTAGDPYMRPSAPRVFHKNPQPIMIASGDMNGVGKEYRYPLGPGMNCMMILDDGATVCNAQGYWYCDQTMTCCGAQTLFRGCGKIMCDRHCNKQYGDQYNQRLTNWHCSEEECADRFYEGQKKCCLIAFFTFICCFCMVGIWSFGSSDKYDQEMANQTEY